MGYAICIVLGVVAGFICTAIIASRGRKKRPKRRRDNDKGEKRKASFEFSKLVLLLVLSTYFVGVFVGIKVVLIDVSQVGAVLAYIGAPTATAIAFYCWKAKAENIIKIKQEHPDVVENPVDLNNITP